MLLDDILRDMEKTTTIDNQNNMKITVYQVYFNYYNEVLFCQRLNMKTLQFFAINKYIDDISKKYYDIHTNILPNSNIKFVLVSALTHEEAITKAQKIVNGSLVRVYGERKNND